MLEDELCSFFFGNFIRRIKNGLVTVCTDGLRQYSVVDDFGDGLCRTSENVMPCCSKIRFGVGAVFTGAIIKIKEVCGLTPWVLVRTCDYNKPL